MESLMVIDLAGQDLAQGYPKLLNDMLLKFAKETKDRYVDKDVPEKEREDMGYNVARDFVTWLAKGSVQNIAVPRVKKLKNNISSEISDQ